VVGGAVAEVVGGASVGCVEGGCVSVVAASVELGVAVVGGTASWPIVVGVGLTATCCRGLITRK